MAGEDRDGGGNIFLGKLIMSFMQVATSIPGTGAVDETCVQVCLCAMKRERAHPR